MTRPPKKWKMAVLIWTAIYPTITVLFFLFGENLEHITPLPLRTFIITLMIVPLMVFCMIPGLQLLFSNWLKT